MRDEHARGRFDEYGLGHTILTRELDDDMRGQEIPRLPKANYYSPVIGLKLQ